MYYLKMNYQKLTYQKMSYENFDSSMTYQKLSYENFDSKKNQIIKIKVNNKIINKLNMINELNEILEEKNFNVDNYLKSNCENIPLEINILNEDIFFEY